MMYQNKKPTITSFRVAGFPHKAANKRAWFSHAMFNSAVQPITGVLPFGDGITYVFLAAEALLSLILSLLCVLF